MNTPTEQMPNMGEREFRELADNAPVMIWRSRTDKLCDWFNKPWRDFAGKTLEQLYGYGWAEDVHPDDFDRCVATYVNAFDAREPFTMPYRLRRHDGVYRWFLDNGAPFYRGGEFAGYFGSCIDITEQRDLEEHQRILLAELNHRVKNNLQLIITFLQLSMIRAQTDEAKTLLHSAIRRVHGVGVMEEELYKNAKGMIDLSEYLSNLSRSLLNIEGSGNATLMTETQPMLVPYELAANLGLIVNELVTNAVKHGEVEPLKVYLTVRPHGETGGQIVVADNGRGFSNENLQAVQKSSSISGNALIRALAGRCNASLQHGNDHGASVTITFPLS